MEKHEVLIFRKVMKIFCLSKNYSIFAASFIKDFFIANDIEKHEEKHDNLFKLRLYYRY